MDVQDCERGAAASGSAAGCGKSVYGYTGSAVLILGVCKGMKVAPSVTVVVPSTYVVPLVDDDDWDCILATNVVQPGDNKSSSDTDSSSEDTTVWTPGYSNIAASILL